MSPAPQSAEPIRHQGTIMAAGKGQPRQKQAGEDEGGALDLVRSTKPIKDAVNFSFLTRDVAVAVTADILMSRMKMSLTLRWLVLVLVQIMMMHPAPQC
eukprot:scaffold274_cov78-Skeletonema_dohrnii-CCMP3373.AAC.4